MLAITPNHHELVARGLEPRLFPYEWKRSNLIHPHLVLSSEGRTRTRIFPFGTLVAPKATGIPVCLPQNKK